MGIIGKRSKNRMWRIDLLSIKTSRCKISFGIRFPVFKARSVLNRLLVLPPVFPVSLFGALFMGLLNHIFSWNSIDTKITGFFKKKLRSLSIICNLNALFEVYGDEYDSDESSEEEEDVDEIDSDTFNEEEEDLEDEEDSDSDSDHPRFALYWICSSDNSRRTIRGEHFCF